MQMTGQTKARVRQAKKKKKNACLKMKGRSREDAKKEKEADGGEGNLHSANLLTEETEIRNVSYRLSFDERQ